MKPRRLSRILIGATFSCTALFPQSGRSRLPVAEKPHGPFFDRSYEGATVAPIQLANSPRLSRLLRAGSLYLTVRDAIALAIENNLNLQIQRYALPTADWAVERAEAGGPIRGLSQGAPQVGAVDLGVGVLGAIQSAGVGVGGGGGGGFVGGGGGAIIQQIGPVVVNFDPSLTGSTTFSHLTYPQSNLSLSHTTALVDVNHVYNQQIKEGLPSGASISYQNYAYSQRENAPGDTLNPAFGPYMRVTFQQPLLQNYGVALNSRSIRVARNGRASARETFRLQMINLVASVIDQYWAVVAAGDEFEARRRALEISRKFYEDTKKEIAIGAIAGYAILRTEAEVARRSQDVVLAEIALRQQEATLKEQLTQTEDPLVDAATIVPLDHIEVPERDDLPPLRELVATAMAKRPDVAVSRIGDENAAINAIGTANGLLPILIAYTGTQDRGSSGTPSVATTSGPAPSFVGGYGTALGQILRHDFPTEYAGLYLSGLPLHNRQAQADYGIEQLQLQASELSSRKAANEIAVNVSNQVIALRQARARYTTAVNTRGLQEQVLDADQTRFALGTATLANVIADQRALVTAQISEVNTLAAYARARVALDQVLGETLEENDINLDEGVNGQVERQSRIPDVLGAAKNTGAAPPRTAQK